MQPGGEIASLGLAHPRFADRKENSSHSSHNSQWPSLREMMLFYLFNSQWEESGESQFQGSLWRATLPLPPCLQAVPPALALAGRGTAHAEPSEPSVIGGRRRPGELTAAQKVAHPPVACRPCHKPPMAVISAAVLSRAREVDRQVVSSPGWGLSTESDFLAAASRWW